MDSSLIKKLKIKSGFKVLIYDAPSFFLEFINSVNRDFIFETKISSNYQEVILFVENSNYLNDALSKINKLLSLNLVFWIAYPKKESGIKTDLSMMYAWKELEIYDLRPVTSVAIDKNWSALQMKPSSQVKQSKTSNKGILNTEYAEFIDVKFKKITLPEYITNILAKEPKAELFFNNLSYSHRKEYLLWLLTAKQESTRDKRQKLFIEKLLEGKKNPAEK